VLFRWTAQKWRKPFWLHPNLFQIDMQIISDFSTPPCVLDPWKMCVAVLHILMRRPNDTAVVLKATMRHYPHSMSLKPSVSESFCSHLHIILVHNSASSLHTSPSKPTVTICVKNTELIRPKSVTLFAHNAGFKYSTVGYNIWAVMFERLERCLLLIMTHKSLGIGMENTKLLCWMQYIPTRRFLGRAPPPPPGPTTPPATRGVLSNEAK
jgi:hypothetical protein